MATQYGCSILMTGFSKIVPIPKNYIFISIFRKSCKEFTFGGCEGNGNRYTTQSECESVCLLQEEPLASGAENEEFWAAICKMDIGWVHHMSITNIES
jgi:hypothetical protein